MKTIATTLIALTFAATTAFAQEETATPETTTAAATSTAATATSTEPATAEETADRAPAWATSEETRGEFLRVLGRYPPQVGRVLKLDPSLFHNASYLASYPAVAEFLAQHPEVAHTPAFYLERVSTSEFAPATGGELIWQQTVEGFSILGVMLLVIGTLAWLIRTLIEHRRWSRVTRTQIEVHGKLMDRLQSNEDLLAYMATPAGKRFLESAPIALDAAAPRAVGAPISRILWSMQVGVIVAVAGFGLQIVSRTVDAVAAPPFLAMGTIALAVGLGFLLSALVSFVLSKRLGLLAQSETPAE